jgi:hypothetical protein
MTIYEKTAEHLHGLLKLPHVGSCGVDALYQEVEKQGKAYHTKLKSGLTLENLKEWYKVERKYRKINVYWDIILFTAEKSNSKSIS